MKKIWIVTLWILLGLVNQGFAQDKTPYHPEDDASKAIEALLVQAKQENKHLLLQVGGNWCKWCIRFHQFMESDSLTGAALEKDFLYYPLNYSKENKNASLLEKYGHPERFGFPVFVVVDTNNTVLHIQDSWYLEDGKEGYDSEKTERFLKLWSPKAMDPKTYK